MKNIRLKRDLVIKAGIVLTNCDGEAVEFVEGNFKASTGLGINGVVDIYINEDVVKEFPEKFEFVDDDIQDYDISDKTILECKIEDLTLNYLEKHSGQNNGEQRYAMKEIEFLKDVLDSLKK